jgi:hypothetical protein
MADELPEFEIGMGPTRPITITLNEGTLAAARKVAGPRGTSSYIERVLRDALQLERQKRYLDEFEAKNGAFAQEDLAWAEGVWNDAQDQTREAMAAADTKKRKASAARKKRAADAAA